MSGPLEEAFAERPSLAVEIIAKLLHKLGGHVIITTADYPSGPFNIQSKISPDSLELQLDYSGTAAAPGGA